MVSPRSTAPPLARSPGMSPRVGWALAVAAMAAGLLLFLWLARTWQSGIVWPVDLWAAEVARAAWSPRGQAWVLRLTHLGDPITLWAVAATVAAVLWRRGEPWLAGAWLFTLAGNAVWNPLLKTLYERIRPVADVSGLVANGYSFPSGHSSGAMVVYGMLAWVIWRLVASRWHLPVVVLAAMLILAIGASRVYLQAHFASDVLAGFALGAAWLALCIAGFASRLAPRV